MMNAVGQLIQNRLIDEQATHIELIHRRQTLPLEPHPLFECIQLILSIEYKLHP